MNISPAGYGHFFPGYTALGNRQSYHIAATGNTADVNPVSPLIRKKLPQTDNHPVTPASADESTHPSTGSDTAPEHSNSTRVNGQLLTNEEKRLVEQLKQTDSKVRRHEMAHIAAGGRYITSGAQFTYKRGPDGRNYAVKGEVGIDTSPIPGDPAATIQKMKQVKSSALAPANPSAQDRKVAAKASSLASKALSELMMQAAKEQAQSNETSASGNGKVATDSYATVSTLSENDYFSFQVAV